MHSYRQALEDFRQARRQAFFADIIGRVTGKSTELLSYEEIRKSLKATGNSSYLGLKNVPLKAIVGSVGRFRDFTRDFLPRSDTMGDRWARVELVQTESGTPPIELYKVGEAYFVIDGHHRVSVARQMGSETIEAYVIEIETKVPLLLQDDPSELIIKTRQADFFECTELNETRPQAELRLTEAGRYRLLLRQIEQTRHELAQHALEEVTLSEAAVHWYDNVYLPIVELIRSHDILRDFPNRTETDLYVWLLEHRQDLSQLVNLPNSKAELSAVVDKEMQSQAKESVTPDMLESGPAPGTWRTNSLRKDQLFRELLVPLSGSPNSWLALQQAIQIARFEPVTVQGLHIVANESERKTDKVFNVQEQFVEICRQHNLAQHFQVVVGKVADQICQQARYADLIVTNLAYPPGQQAWTRLSSGFRSLIQRGPCPVWAVPAQPTTLKHILLAYRNTPKGLEALYLAAYLASKWHLDLSLVGVSEKNSSMDWSFAKNYLDVQHIAATYIEKTGSAADCILQAAQESASDLLLIGGYKAQPMVELVLGSIVDKVLQATPIPVCVCR
jgi:nucleotide-binding universal stress UspA family protein